MAHILVLATPGNIEVLPALSLLSHRVRAVPAQAASLVDLPTADVLVVDGTRDIAKAKTLCKLLASAGTSAPVIVVVTEGGLTAISPEWDLADIIVNTAGPAETDARIRLAAWRTERERTSGRIDASGVTIDENSYSAKLRGKPLDLTYKEFELLRFFASHPSRVFTREQLLSEVWGYDYFGGTRTVDVHVRRLRAKLGDLDSLIGTVRNVGYRFNVFDDDPAEGRAE